MWFRILALFLVSCQIALAYDACGSSVNAEGFVRRPQKNKAGLGEFPWTVALYKKDAAKPHCVGSIIDDSVVLTTAFCVKMISSPSDLIIRAGLWDLNRTSVDDFQMQQRVAEAIHSHPMYTSPDPINNDIAIIHVNQPFKFAEHIQKVCLDTGNPKSSKSGCIASGWGAESYESQDELSQHLKRIPMDHVDRDICVKQLRIALKGDNFVLPEGFFCAGGNEADLCIGDTGAPLICPIVGDPNKYVLTGLSSFGVKCFTETPGVYTNITKYINWIEEHSKAKPQ